MAIAFDVDANRELALTLDLGTLPTFIAFRDGNERARIRGLRSWQELLLCLYDLHVPESDVPETSFPECNDDGTQRAIGKRLFRAGRYDEATESYVWCWKHMDRIAPDGGHVRESFVAGEIEALVRVWPSAHSRFSEIRDEAECSARNSPGSLDAWTDWVVLNSVLGDDERTLTWFDAIKRDQTASLILRRVERHLIRPLRLRERRADLGGLYADPIEELASLYEALSCPLSPSLSAAVSGRSIQHNMAEQFRTEVADLVASLEAAGRASDARQVRNEALRLDPTEEMQGALEQVPVRYD